NEPEPFRERKPSRRDDRRVLARRMSGRGCRVESARLEHAMGRDARREERGLRVLGARQLFERAFEAELGKREPQRPVGFLQDRARFGVALRERSPHADRLRSLSREEERGRYHSTTAAAHVKPPPKVTISTRSPEWIRPPRRASSSASGIEAAEVFP